jgi:pilus assembly protein CpaE
MSTSDYDFGTSAPGPQDGSFGTPHPGGGGVPVVIVDDDQAVRSRLAMQLGETAVTATSIDELRARLSGAPVVAVLGPSVSSPMGLADAERLVAEHPEVGALLIAAELTTDLFRQSLRAGIKDVLAAPVDTASLSESVRRIASGLATAPVRGGYPSEVDSGDQGRVLAVFSTKGGAGKSVLATNLAVVLAKRSSKPVVLVDADLQFGDISVMLKLAPHHTVVDAVASLDRLDASLLQSLLTRHEPSGLYILAAPLEPQYADQITATEMVQIIDLLRRFAGHVVIDTPAHFNDVVLAMIEMSDDVLLIAGMDIPNIKNVKIGLQTLRLLNTPPEKLHLVLNRANSKVKLDVSEVERTLQIKAEGLVPSDVVVPQSVNKGVPLVVDAPKSGVARSIEALADAFGHIEQGRRKR